jgi:hypothetical protein
MDMSGEDNVREKFHQTLLVRRIRVWMARSSVSLLVRMRPRYLKEETCVMGLSPMKKVVDVVSCCKNIC